MGFQQGLSGIAAASKALDVTGNNIANSATVGFKAGGIRFADMYNSSLGLGSGGAMPGGGVNVADITQSFTQGALSQTGNFLDMAISGSGFFEVLLGDGTRALTRNGQFDIDKNGFIVTASGERVLGYQETAVDGGLIAPATPGALNMQPLQIPINPITAQPTTEIGLMANLSADTPLPAVTPFDMTDADSYSFSTVGNVYDSLGVSHNAVFYYARQAPLDSNTWEVHVSVDGGASSALATPLQFGTDGLLIAGASQSFGPVTFTNGSAPLNISDLDFSAMTQFSGKSALKEFTRNGYEPADLAGISIDASGLIEGRYSNGETRGLGYVMVSNVRNLSGLQPAGDNLFKATGESGEIIRGLAGVAGLGTVNSGVAEGSNVDLTAEMVAMIVQQRAYQANAQTIRTQDQLLQTMINLR